METIVTEVVDEQGARDTRGRRITSQQRRAELLAQYKTSGMTQKAFAKRAGVNIHTFISWLADQKRGEAAGALGARAGAPVGFVELRTPALASAGMAVLEVVLRDGRVARGSDAGALASLVRQLEA
jgi:transposase-like protein